MDQNTDTTTDTTAKAGDEQQSAQPDQATIDRVVKERLERERKKFEREKAEMLKQYEGLDKDEYLKLKQEAEERENKKLEEQGKFEELRKKWSADLEKTKSEYEAKIQEKDATLRRLVLDDKARNSALKSGVCPEDIDDVLKLTSSNFAMDDDGSIRVLDSDGKETTETLDDFFGKTFKERKPKFYQGSSATGSGMQGSANRPQGGTPRAINANDAAAFQANIDKIARGEVQVIRQ